MYIRRFKYKAKDVDCKYCTEYRGKNKCTHSVCPYISERMEAGAVTYQDAVTAMVQPGCQMARRLPKLIERYQDYLWIDDRHKSRMEFFHTRMGYVPGRNTPAYYAVMYLLTANDTIHFRTANCFCHDGIDFQFAILKGISTSGYVLYRAAVTLYTAEPAITLSEMADPKLVDDDTFRMIINAMLIARYGIAAFRLKKEEPTNEQ